jgi:hypothetical protein
MAAFSFWLPGVNLSPSAYETSVTRISSAQITILRPAVLKDCVSGMVLFIIVKVT